MSDTYVSFVPKDPFHLPSATQRASALDIARSLVAEGEEYEWIVYPSVHFVDCGENLEEIICPGCGAHLRIDYFTENDPVLDWWRSVFENVRLDEGANCLDVRETDLVQMPCCSKMVRLLDLRFEWPAAFGRCELSIMNPNLSDRLSGLDLARLEAAVACELYEIWAHY